MFALDLFNTKYEKELKEGAVDSLEARRIDDLNMKMQDLLDRTKGANPKMRDGLKREFQRVKAERDSYFKINPATGMNSGGTLGTTKGKLDEQHDSPVAGAITRRILMQRHDLLKQYGPEAVTAAIDNVADYVGDVEEIGSSDVSGWVNQVERMLKENPPEAFREGSLNEVSVDTLSSYGKKAEKSAAKNADLSDKYQEKAFNNYNKGGAAADRSWNDTDKAIKYAAKSDQRNAGADLAAVKLGKKFSKGMAEAPGDKGSSREHLAMLQAEREKRKQNQAATVTTADRNLKNYQAGRVRASDIKVAEESKPYGDYPQSPRAFGAGNFQRIVRANMGNLPSVTLEFPKPKDNILLDKNGIDLISDYYDRLNGDSLKNHFIYRVLPSADEVLTVLKKLGWNQAVQPELPGIPTQGELPLQEKKKFDSNSDVTAGDTKVARELQKLRAQYPAAKSDVEAVAKAEIDSTDRSQQQLSAIKGANTEQDRLLKQLVALDKKQGTEIGSLDNENDRLEQQLAQVEKTNANLAQAIDQMGGPAQDSNTDTGQPRAINLIPNAPADAPSQTQTQAQPTAAATAEPEQKFKSNAMSQMAQNLSQPRKVQGVNRGPAPSIRGVTDLDQYRADAVSRAKSAIADKNFAPLANQLVNKGVVTRTGTDEAVNKEQRLQQGDPVVVTAPNEFEGKTGEIHELSPSGKFVIVNLYNYGKHSMHLSDVAYNDHADQEEANDWYDEDVAEGGSRYDDNRTGFGKRSREDDEYHVPDPVETQYNIKVNGQVINRQPFANRAAAVAWAKQAVAAEKLDPKTATLSPINQVNELSTDKLAQYKKAAGTDATAADKRGDYERGDKRFSGIVKATKKQFANDLKKHKDQDQGVEEGWKDVAIGGAMALGALGAGHTQAADLGGYNTQYLQQVVSGEHPRPMVSVNDAKQELQARMNGKQQTVSAPQADVPKGFSKEYLQKAADPNRFGRYLISVEKAQELLTGMQEGVAEGLQNIEIQDDKSIVTISVDGKDRFMLQPAEGHKLKSYGGGTYKYWTIYDVERKKNRINPAIGMMSKNQAIAYVKKLVRLENKRQQGMAEVTGDKPFDKMMTTIKQGTNKQKTVDRKEQQKQTQQRARDTFGNMFGGGNPADKLSVRKGMAEGLLKEPATRKEYLDQRDKLFRMMAVDSNPANKQIIKQALQDLEARYGNLKNTVKEESSTASEAVERAILNRIMVAHTDLLMKFGPDKVMQAAEEVAYNVGDVDEIGTSDVSAYVNQVKQILGAR